MKIWDTTPLPENPDCQATDAENRCKFQRRERPKLSAATSFYGAAGIADCPRELVLRARFLRVLSNDAFPVRALVQRLKTGRFVRS